MTDAGRSANRNARASERGWSTQRETEVAEAFGAAIGDRRCPPCHRAFSIRCARLDARDACLPWRRCPAIAANAAGDHRRVVRRVSL